MAGIYLHIPFCTQACYYCDFHFSTNTSTKSDLVLAMGEELKLQTDYLESESVNTIYFGGGTPSLLNRKELAYLLNLIHKIHDVHVNAEITLECNPDDLTDEKLADLKAAGVNRLSIGIQSFNDSMLKYLNRLHSADTAVSSFRRAREAGFANISIDLIYAIPGLSTPQWKNELATAVDLAPEHISAYTLTIEKKTAFGSWLAHGKIKPVDEALAAEQFEVLMSELTAAGFEHYEISNFAKPSFVSRHNSSYWGGETYLGIGPSAHSFNTRSRQYNVSNNLRYVRSIKAGTIPFETEVLRNEDRINEYILTTLRTSAGCNVEKLKNDFGYDLLKDHDRYLQQLKDHQLIQIQDHYLTLTKPGKLLADKISSDLFLIS
jgi:oxygen-independent coproporphyrinogen-3 oxidase